MHRLTPTTSMMLNRRLPAFATRRSLSWHGSDRNATCGHSPGTGYPIDSLDGCNNNPTTSCEYSNIRKYRKNLFLLAAPQTVDITPTTHVTTSYTTLLHLSLHQLWYLRDHQLEYILMINTMGVAMYMMLYTLLKFI